MYPAEFEYFDPLTVDDAVELLSRLGDQARVLAGGHSLIPLMKLRLARPPALVDLHRIEELRSIRVEPDAVVIGAAATHAAIAESAQLGEALPLLTTVAGLIGDPQVRSCGTLAGSLAHGDPMGDWPAVALTMGAVVVTASPRGQRTIAADQFFTGFFSTALEPDEMITSIRFPRRWTDGYGYQKLRGQSTDWAVVGVAVVVDRADGVVDQLRIGLTNVGPTPVRATRSEQILEGHQPNSELLEAAAEEAGFGLTPSSDIRASAAYRLQMIKVLTRRALEQALEVSNGS